MDGSRVPQIELRQLHAFRIVAEEMHFGRAAARLGISQPPLSQQIRRLERQLDCRLFDRDTRKVALTDGGAALVAVARDVLARLETGLEHVHAVASGEAGRLVIGFTPTTALGILPMLVQAFRAGHAQIEVDLHELLPGALFDALRSEQIDAALMRDPAPARGITAVQLLSEPYVAILPARHRMADPTVPFRLAGLARDPFVLFPPDASQGMTKIVALCAEAGFTPEVAQTVPGWQTAIAMVGSGLGVSILPESVASLHLAGVVYRPLASAIASTVALLRREDDDRPKVAKLAAISVAVMAE